MPRSDAHVRSLSRGALISAIEKNFDLIHGPRATRSRRVSVTRGIRRGCRAGCWPYEDGATETGMSDTERTSVMAFYFFPRRSRISFVIAAI